MRAQGCDVPVHGVCVRRAGDLQAQRVSKKLHAVIDALGVDIDIPDNAIICDDSKLAPGYGLPNEETIAAIRYMARREGILLDLMSDAKARA